MSAPLFLDLSHTSHSRARTGVQRVALALAENLETRARRITYDPYLGRWRDLRAWENANLASRQPGQRRGAAWPLSAKIRGWAGRLGSRDGVHGRAFTTGAVLMPEIFSPHVANHLSQLGRPRVAVFHDAIALKLPECTPAKTVARFPAYLQDLLQFDGIAAVSEDSARALQEYWDWLGTASRPVVRVIPLGVDLAKPADAKARLGGDAPPYPVVLSVGSIEGRKNHLALLEACERLWAAGEEFELRLVGMARPETGSAALAKIDSLGRAGRRVRHEGNADDATLARAYEEATLTVYPSLMEGFGLPVLESIACGKPCICAGYGALGEAARGGGCLTVERVDATTLEGAIQRLLRDASQRASLEQEARARRLKTWAEYTNDIVAFVRELET